MEPDLKYDMFISYSTDPDYRLSKELETFLESFHQVAGRYGQKLKKLEVCRDGSDFKLDKKRAANQEYINQILEEHLRESKWLLVLCSENCAKSSFCNHEIEWFLKNKGPESVLAAFTEGREPGREPNIYFSPHLMEHNIHQTVCYDLRGFKKKSKDWIKVRDDGEEMTKLAAHLYGTSVNEVLPLWKREERKRRVVRRMNSIMTAGIGLLLAMMLWLMFQQKEIKESRDTSQLKSEVTSLANVAFNVLESDRKQGYDTLQTALQKTRGDYESDLIQEKSIIQNLINDLHINMTTLPFYTQTIKTKTRGDVAKIKTRGDESDFSIYILARDDSLISRYFLESTGSLFSIYKEEEIRNDTSINILKFEPASSEDIFIYDESGYLKYLVRDSVRHKVKLPNLLDFDYAKDGYLYVATTREWMKYSLDPESHQLHIVSRVPKAHGGILFDKTSGLRTYSDGIITFTYENRLYAIDNQFSRQPKRIEFRNESAEGIFNYKFENDERFEDPYRRTLAISRGRIVEIYQKESPYRYFKVHKIDDHLSFINSFDFNNQHEILVGSSDKTATVWSENLLDKRLVGHDAAITDVTFVDDDLVLTCDEGNVIRLWNLSELAWGVEDLGLTNQILSITHINDNTVGVLTIDSSMILSLTKDTSYVLRSVESAYDSLIFYGAFSDNCFYSIFDSSYRDQVDFFELGDSVFVGNKEGIVFIYQAPNTEHDTSWRAHSKSVNDLTYMHGNLYLLTGGSDNAVKIWRKEGNRYVEHLSIHDHNDDVVDIDSYKDLFLTVGHDRSVLIYQLDKAGKLTPKTSMIKHNTFINGAAFINEDLVVSGDDEGVLKIWSIQEFEEILKRREAQKKDLSPSPTPPNF